jgi:hypothetical protein
MVGGADEDVAQAIPILSACGSPVRLGPLGSGQVAKGVQLIMDPVRRPIVRPANPLPSRFRRDLHELQSVELALGHPA